MYVTCGPRQVFLSQCGAETPKGWAPLEERGGPVVRREERGEGGRGGERPTRQDSQCKRPGVLGAGNPPHHSFSFISVNDDLLTKT